MSRPPLPFPGNGHEHVPIVGQPIRVEGWTLGVTAHCNCPYGGMITFAKTSSQPEAALAVAQCPACGKGWAIGRGTKLHLDLTQVVLARPDEATSPAPPSGDAS